MAYKRILFGTDGSDAAKAAGAVAAALSAAREGRTTVILTNSPLMRRVLINDDESIGGFGDDERVLNLCPRRA